MSDRNPRRTARPHTMRRQLTGFLVLICLGIVTCRAAPGGFPPPCSALARGDCIETPRDERLTCDPDERVRSALADLVGFTYAACPGHPNRHMLLGPGAEEPTDDELAHFVEESRSYPFALAGVRGTSRGCCENDDARCLRIKVDRCTGPRLDVVAEHAMRWAKGLDMQAKKLRIVLDVGGSAGPRCEVTDAGCGPIPYDDELTPAYDPMRGRFPYPESFDYGYRDRDDQPCTHDGDCLVMNYLCRSWVQPTEIMVLALHVSSLEDKFCGCVLEHCSWFAQN